MDCFWWHLQTPGEILPQFDVRPASEWQKLTVLEVRKNVKKTLILLNLVETSEEIREVLESSDSADIFFVSLSYYS